MMRLPRSPVRTDREDGFVLIPIIAVVLLFATVSGSISARSRLLTLQETSRARTIQFAARVDGLVRLLALRLMTDGDLGALPADGRLVRCPGAGAQIAVRITDQDGLLDLNGAPLPMLLDVLGATGLEPETVKKLAYEIVDYRSNGDVAQPIYGAKDEDYRRAGLGWGPRNGFFVDPQEFVQIPTAAADPALVRKLMPLLTTYNGRPAIDPSLLAAGQPGLIAPGGPTEARLAKWAAKSRHSRFAITVDARDPAGKVSFARQAVLLDGGADGPVFLKWARQPADASATGATETWALRTGDAPSPVCALTTAAFAADKP